MKTYKLLDGSWAYLIKDGKLCVPRRNICAGRIYALIAKCDGLPACTHPLYGEKCQRIKNNIIIQDISSGEVFFSQLKYLYPFE
jgi:hypothetical protein